MQCVSIERDTVILSYESVTINVHEERARF